jgi:hypothetical protein
LAEVPVSGSAPLSAWERWTWARCRERILGLKHRLGYGENLWILGFELLDDGRLRDPFHGVEVFDPARAGPAKLIPAEYSAVPEMLCLLSTYAEATETPLTGQPLAMAELDPVRRAELPAEDCATLLCYTDWDWVALQATGVPLFGERLARGDLAFVAWPLPRIPITLTLWRGEEELPDGMAAAERPRSGGAVGVSSRRNQPRSITFERSQLRRRMKRQGDAPMADPG